MRSGERDGQSIMLFDILFVKENGRTCTICNLKNLKFKLQKIILLRTRYI